MILKVNKNSFRVKSREKAAIVVEQHDYLANSHEYNYFKLMTDEEVQEERNRLIKNRQADLETIEREQLKRLKEKYEK